MDPHHQYQQAVIGLAGILGKILKVIVHTDPTAKTKQAELYAKYQTNVKLFAKNAKNKWPWASLLAFVRQLEQIEQLNLSPEDLEKVKQKLIKDLGELMVEKPRWDEFETAPAPPPAAKPKAKFTAKEQETIAQAAAKVAQEKAKSPEAKQAKGQAVLLGLIQAINRIGPDALEAKINKHSPTKK